MSLQVERLEKNMVKLTIESSVEEFEAAMEAAYKKNRNRLSIPGFRKGKASRKVIEKMYGPSIFYEDAANAIIPDAYEKAAEESGLDIVSQPEIDVVQVEEGKPFIFTAEVAVKPEVTLGDYKGVEVAKREISVTAQEIDQAVESDREQNARLLTVDGEALDGDQAVIDFEGFVDGEAFEGGKGENYPLTLGSHSFIEGFEEQLVGHKSGDEVEVNVTFPENYQAEDLAGKPATFHVVVKEIKRKELPDLDDDFAQDVSEFDTMAEYRADIEKKIVERKENAAKTAKEDEAVDRAVENAQMEIPDAMINTQVRQMAEDFSQRIRSQGLTLEQYFQFTGMNANSFLETLRPQALKRIQSRLVLEAIAEAENIQPGEEEIDAEIQKMADSYRMELDKAKEMLGEEGRKGIAMDLAVQKAIDLVTEAAVEVEKPEAEEAGESEE